MKSGREPLTLSYRTPADDLRDPVVQHRRVNRVGAGCLVSFASAAALFTITLLLGTVHWRFAGQATAVLWSTGGAALLSVGLVIGVRRRLWGFFLGVCLSIAILFGVCFALVWHVMATMST